MMNRTLLTALAAAAVSTSALVAPALVTPAAAQGNLNIQIGTAPPAPVYEVVPAPRAGYVWAPGYHRYEHRADRAYGDRDHDGVPNIYDRHPDNPYRR